MSNLYISDPKLHQYNEVRFFDKPEFKYLRSVNHNLGEPKWFVNGSLGWVSCPSGKSAALENKYQECLKQS